MKFLIPLLLLLAGCGSGGGTQQAATQQPVAMFIGEPSWMTDPAIYGTLASKLRDKGYEIRSYGLPFSGDLTVWAQQPNEAWIDAYVHGFASTERLISSPAVIIGTSRGAFCAFHLAAAYPIFTRVVGISPAVDLGQLTEFANSPVKPNLYGLTVLETREVFMEIGDQDPRVGTAPTEQLGALLKATVLVKPSAGHSPPPSTFDDVVSWLT